MNHTTMGTSFRAAAVALIAVATLGFGCVQVGPKDDKPLHIVLDVNIRVQVDQAIQELWNSVERRATESTGNGTGPSTGTSTEGS